MIQASPALRVGFVDNMGGAAGLGSERQFRKLLAGCTAGPIEWTRIATHAGVTHAGTTHGGTTGAGAWPVRSARDVAGLPALDLLVFSGAEPRGALAGEPFWPGLTALLDDAAERGRAVLLSCLAAHAAVLHHDGLPRDPLPQKRAGVFRFALDLRHPLVRRAGGRLPRTIAVAHSRCNAVSAAALEAAGYAVLSGDAEAGVDMATARGRPWLLLQGHPEYPPATLIDQYRRDVGRFLRGIRPDYPAAPVDGLEAESAARFAAFRAQALAAGGAAARAALLGAVPQGRATGAVRAVDRAAVRALLGAWLEECLAVPAIEAAATAASSGASRGASSRGSSGACTGASAGLREAARG